MYAAFQQFAPSTGLGIDLSREYQIATQPLEGKVDFQADERLLPKSTCVASFP